MPDYFMKVYTDNKERIYFGALDIFRPPLKFNDIINKYYPHGISELVISTTWGGYENRDIDILEDLGLTYKNYRCDIESEKTVFFVMNDGRWRHCEPPNPLNNFQKYLNSNTEVINEIMAEIGIRDNDSFFEHFLPDVLVIKISREEIENNDLTRILSKLECLIISNNLAVKMRRKIEFSFDGYNDDIRELYEIDEVRNYVINLSEAFPYLFFFTKLDGNYGTLKVFANCYIKNDKNIKLDNYSPLEIFMTQQFEGLNELTDRLSLSTEENKIISEETIEYLFSD